MGVFFISDTHFSNSRILRSRPDFRTPEEMDAAILAAWQRRVSLEDDVYILGDLGDRFLTDPAGIIPRLPGKKHLITGNHDEYWMARCTPEQLRQWFVEICPYRELQLGDALLTLCHYPMLEWRQSRRNEHSCLIHGHIHSRRNLPAYRVIRDRLPRALNCGVDVNGYMPVTLEELIVNNGIWYGRNV